VLARPGLSAVAAVLAAVVVVSVASAVPSQTSSVVVDLRAPRQLMDGFGVSERVFSDPHVSNVFPSAVPERDQDRILRDLFGRLGLTRVRPLLDQGIQPSPGAPFNFKGKLNDEHIEWVRKARRFGLRTYFPSPVYLEPWVTEADVDAAASWAMTVLTRWRSAGLEPAFYSPQNEPQVNQNFSPDFLRRLVLELGRRLERAGMRTKLVVPDDENPVDALRRAQVILADPEARRYVGAVAFHVYRIGGPDDWSRLAALAARYRKPLWMTEFVRREYGSWSGAMEWASTMQELISRGVSAVDYLWGFFGQWVGGETLIMGRFENNVLVSTSRTPVYWITGQWSRFVRPGDLRVATRSTNDAILANGFTGRGLVTVVLVNRGQAAQSVAMSLVRGRSADTARVVRSSATERWRALPAVPVRRGRLTLTLPPQSVTTVVVRRAR